MKKNLLGTAVLFALTLLAAAPAEAKRPKNFRLMWKKAAAVEEPEVSTAAAVPRLMSGRWTPEVRAALDKFLAERGKGSPGYDAAKPPVAVLPWSDALVIGDPAELVFLRLTTRVDFHFSDEWWE
ncbi:MAG: hypothetical protein PHS14_08105, partial [Elusimicrobia bacterium]|nr:hypothetical protein [Elusimicrobiota bacterium]